MLTNLAKKEQALKNPIIQRNINQSSHKYAPRPVPASAPAQGREWPPNKKPYLFVNKVRVHYFFS